MNRYFITNENNTLNQEDIHHIKNVMRFKTDDLIEVVVNNKIYLAKLIIDNNITAYELLNEIDGNTQLFIDLYQGLPKGNKSDDVVRLSTLFGVNDIYFVQMNRSIAKIQNQDTKLNRLSKIALESSKLSHHSKVPQINFLIGIKNAKLSDYDKVYICDEEEHNNTLNSIATNLQNKRCAFIIGPEGGITDEERKYFKSINAAFISLGKAILPTELAAIKFLDAFYLKNTK